MKGFAIALARLAAGWFDRRSRELVGRLDRDVGSLLSLWVMAIAAFGALKVSFAPLAPGSVAEWLAMWLPYLLLAAAPLAGYRIACACFLDGVPAGQPSLRLCRWGKWRDLDVLSVRANPLYGPAGFLASLTAGILLNVPFRSIEFLLAMPAVALRSPDWAHTIVHVMTIDVIVMNFFYMVCFVMALRSAPLFPRMLVFVWLIDIVMQLQIASWIAATPDMPQTIAPALHNLLEGNIQKVLISAFIWLPYIILSDRVNLTYRHRVPV